MADVAGSGDGGAVLKRKLITESDWSDMLTLLEVIGSIYPTSLEFFV